MNRIIVRTSVIGLVILSLYLAGCATNTAPGSIPTTDEPSLSSAVHAADATPSPNSKTASELSFLDVSAVVDQQFEEMTTVAEKSDAVAFGTINRWLAGDKVTTKTGMLVGAATLAEFTVEKIVEAKEGIDLKPGDVIYLPSMGGMDSAELAARTPRDLQALVYLGHEMSAQDLTVNEAYVVEKGDPEAAGAPRWILQSSQAFVVVDQDNPNLLVWPDLGNVAEGALEDVLPGGRLDGLTEEQRSSVRTTK